MTVIESISAFHKLTNLPAPLHPLVSVFRVTDISFEDAEIWKQFSQNFYAISLKKGLQGKIKYGQQYYDFDKGTMTFVAPKQIHSLDVSEGGVIDRSYTGGHVLLFHPDFLRNYPLGTAIKNYGFFSYAVSEALQLSEKEEKNITDIFLKIDEEYQHIDKHTQPIIISQIELLLNYGERFYERQFITRSAVNHDLLSKMERLLNEYLENKEGLPTVEMLAAKLNLTPHYLSDMLRSLTGQSAQQHIQERVIEKAKEYLSLTNLSVAEIAYHLGFEYPQSFNKFFKKKMNVSPLAFRQSFN
jgi:AraC family transcriptional regulator, transcriptional activator of pobA